MTENEVVDHVARWLADAGHRIDSTCHNTSKGDDIAATLRDGTTLFIECKGALSRQGAQLDCWKSAALAVFGAIVDTETNRPEHKHAIAFPDTPLYRATFERTGGFLARQSVTLLWVGADGSVSMAGAPNKSLEQMRED